MAIVSYFSRYLFMQLVVLSNFESSLQNRTKALTTEYTAFLKRSLGNINTFVFKYRIMLNDSSNKRNSGKCLNVIFSFKINTGCEKSSVFGTACDTPCPVACKDSTCHIQNGGCLGCEPGLFGSYCNISCPANCKDNICHGKNGTCFTCEPGWTRIYCKTSNTVHHIRNQDMTTWFLRIFCYH